MSFYIGCYLILSDVIDPKHDHDGWAFPVTVGQHMSDTSNVEDLLIDPEDMDKIPTQIQYGACLWTEDEGFTPDYNYDAFYVKTQEFFYVQGWTSGTALYNEFYVREEAFYVQGWTSSENIYGEFYIAPEPFYVQGFTPIDFFYPLQWTVC